VGKFLRLELESFCSIKSATVDLADQGLVVVSGKNLDTDPDGGTSSNGSGKSTAIVDGLVWPLYGKTTKGGNADSVTPGGNGKGTRAAVTYVADAGPTYEFARHRKHKENGNKIIITKDGEDISRSTAAENNKLILDILGISYDTFLYTTLLGPSSFMLSRLTDQGRKQILEEITGTKIYEDAKLAAREKVKVANQDLLVNKAKVDEIERYIATIAGQKDALQAQIDSAGAQFNNKLADAQASLDGHTSVLSNLLQAGSLLPEPAELAQIPQLEAMLPTLMEQERAASSALSGAKAERRMLYESLCSLSNTDGQDSCSQCGSELTAEHLKGERDSRSDAVNTKDDLVAALTKQHDAALSKDQEIRKALQGLNCKKSTYSSQTTRHTQDVTRAQDNVGYAETSLAAVKAWDPCAGLAATMEGLVGSQIEYTAHLEAAAYAFSQSAKAVEDYTYWVSAFQDLRVTALDGALDFINGRLANYANQLFDKVDVRLVNLDGKIVIQVSTMGGTYESASGGEKDRIDLCLAFALLDLARQCTQWGSNLLVMDEIAVHVDTKGVESLMTVVEQLVGSVESVFMISHNPVFDGYGDKSLVVTRSGGESTVSLD
jgi:DNA repair exonuclease SbcCD ATPase subunit